MRHLCKANRDAKRMSEARPRASSARATPTAPSQDPMLVYCNPCFGIPPIVIASPLRYFGIQMLVGLACILGLLLFGETP